MGWTSLSRADTKSLSVALKAYKYVSPNLTIAERLFLNNFWGWWAENVYPRWLAPNLITLIGFLACTVSTVLLFFFSPQLDGKAPQWWYLCCAITGFIYQTFDGSDGKQARRTKSGSALGELFDHGCDAIVTTWIFCFGIELMAFGSDSLVFIFALIGCQTCFYVSNLTLLHMGHQHFNEVDAQEFQFVLQVAMWCSFFFGTAFFGYYIPVPAVAINFISENFPNEIAKEFTAAGVSTRFVMVLCSCLSVIFNNIAGIFHIVKFYLTEKPAQITEGRGLGGLTIQMANVLTLDILTFIAWTYAVRMTQDKAVMFVILVSGLAHADLMFHILVTRVALLPYPALYKSRGVMAIAVLTLIYYGHHTGVVPSSALLPLQMTCLFGIILSCWQYVSSMGNAIASVLGIEIFRIKTNTN